MNRLASRADDSYRLAKAIVKPDGTIRQPFDAQPPLKAIHRRLQKRIFDNVRFPDYLTGSLKGKDARWNAALHTGAKIVVTEDIKNFFPSVTANIVYSIWAGFFRFEGNVAQLLTLLCTKDGMLPQGAIPSSYLANLAFWEQEWKLVANFRAAGITYSRYVDDVTLSSRESLDKPQLTRCISNVYSFMAAQGFRPKRTKQEIRRAHAPMIATKLMVNRRPALLVQERQGIRSAVYQLEREEMRGCDPKEIKAKIDSVAGRVGRLTQLHPTDGHALKLRIAALRRKLASISAVPSAN
ncbi:reverse transcriptase family protein [Dyella dinghuensis]|uniref:reverse transcriptase family protein n=1 Tax=Dyella dinghuensis TaxID=1920169 RepID=UPI00131548AB|nr:reverse transcriptase family protein [Dyella dinghuensis]